MADDKVEEKSLAQTVLTVKAASSNVESTTIETHSKIVGRTIWDGAVDIAKMLGPYAPWVIMLSGVVFAFFKFSQLKETAQSKAREQVQTELDSAHRELRSTYEQLGKMTTQELENVSSMLRLHGDTAKSTEAQRKRYNELHEQAVREKEELDKARFEADRAKADAALAKKEGQDAAKAAADAREQADAANKDMLAKKAELDRQSDEINQRADKIGDLNQKLIELATRVAATSSINQALRELAGNILKEYSPDPQNLLTNFASNPSRETFSALQNLIGASANNLEPSLKTGSDFAFWQRVISTPKDDARSFYVGVLRQTALSNDNMLFVRIENEKVVDVSGFSKILAVRVPSANDWNEMTGYVLYEDISDKRSGAESFPPVGETWTVAHTLRAETSPGEALFGLEKPLPWTSIADLKQKYSALFKAVTSDTPGSDGAELSEAISMLDRAQIFPIESIKDHFPKSAPEDLRQAFAGLLTSAIKHETSVPGIKIAPKLARNIFGKIAAAALKPSFRPIDVTANKKRIDSQPHQEALPELYTVLCEHTSRTDRLNKVRFSFSRDTAGSAWTLVNFEESVQRPDGSDL